MTRARRPPSASRAQAVAGDTRARGTDELRGREIASAPARDLGLAMTVVEVEGYSERSEGSSFGASWIDGVEWRKRTHEL